jgi:hypothetical protein
MPDDCPVDDASRRALRDLARRAEWRGRAGAAGAAQDADTLRELGGEMRAALARQGAQAAQQEGQDQQAQEQQGGSWGRQAVERLAACCLKARADWTPEQIAELARLREDAVIALAPGPGESDTVPPSSPRGRRPALAGLAALRSGRARPVALVVVGCVLLIALILAAPHFFGGNGSTDAPSASSSTASSAAPTTASSTPTTSPSVSTSVTGSTSSPATSSSAATGATPTAPASSSSSRVTAIHITNSDSVPGNPPEVILTYAITASGTGDVLIDITVNGSIPTQLAPTEPIDESGQTTYPDLTQTIDLSPWCGHSSVVVKISSGSVSQSTTVPISGC